MLMYLLGGLAEFTPKNREVQRHCEKSCARCKTNKMKKIIHRNSIDSSTSGKSMDFPEVLESIEFLCIIFFILFVLHRAQDFSQCLWTSRFFGVNSANPPKRYINI